MEGTQGGAERERERESEIRKGKKTEAEGRKGGHADGGEGGGHMKSQGTNAPKPPQASREGA